MSDQRQQRDRGVVFVVCTNSVPVEDTENLLKVLGSLCSVTGASLYEFYAVDVDGPRVAILSGSIGKLIEEFRGK